MLEKCCYSLTICYNIGRKEEKDMTSKQHFNKIVRKALTINRHLNELRKECEDLIDKIYLHADEYDEDDYTYNLRTLEETLEELRSFDLEDSIPDEHTCEY